MLRLSIASLILAYICMPLISHATNSEAGVIKSTKGQVNIVRAGKKIEASVGSSLTSADTLETGANSAAGVTLNDGTMLSLGANSTLILSKFTFHPTQQTGELDATIKKGTLGVISGKLAKTSREAVVYRTPNAILGVRGTAFLIEVGEDEEPQR